METRCNNCKKEAALEQTRPVKGTSDHLCICCALAYKWEGNRCGLKGCRTPTRLVNARKLPLRYSNLSLEHKAQLDDRFGICGQMHCCRGCYTKLQKAAGDITHKASTSTVTKQPAPAPSQPKTPQYTYSSDELPTMGNKTKSKTEKQAKAIFTSAVKTATDEIGKLARGGEEFIQKIGCFNTFSASIT